MAIIAGTTVKWRTSPRIVVIPTGTDEVTVNDFQDTAQDLEDDEEGMTFPHLRNTSGGEDLGGGQTVSATTELQNAKIAFVPETTNRESGTVTTTNAAGLVLIDSAATFITNLVTPGDTVINFTDQSVGTVLTVDSEIQLTLLQAMDDGTDNQFTSGDVYKVYPNEQKELSGGNIVAVNDVDASILPILPTFGTHITRTSSSGATTQELADIQNMAFQNSVWIDVANTTGLAQSGTVFPAGTPRQPVDNLADALTIDSTRQFKRLQIIGSITFGTTDNIDDYEIVGQDVNKSIVTLTSGVSTEKTEFENCEVSGDVSGAISVRNCHLNDVDNLGSTTIETEFLNCVLEPGTYVINSSATKDIYFLDCKSGVAGTSTAILDSNGAVADIMFRNYSGGIQLNNFSAGADASFDFSSGQIILDATCTSGNIVIRGADKITDNSAGATIVDDSSEAITLDNAEKWAKLSFLNS